MRADLDGWHDNGPDAAAGTKLALAPPPTVRVIDIMEVDWLAPDRSLSAIANRDELYERTSAVMEHPGDPDEIELVLAALARFDAGVVESGGLRWSGSLIPGLPGRWACAGARSRPSSRCWSSARPGARVSSRTGAGAVAVGGVERLRFLRELAPFVSSLLA